MQCARCGHNVDPTGTFRTCPNCGNVVATEQFGTPPQYTNAPYVIPTPPETPKPKRSPVGLIVGAFGVVLLVVVGLFAFNGSRGESAGASTPEDVAAQLQKALENKDPAAALALLDPAEVPHLGELYEASVDAALKAADKSGNADPESDYDALRSAIDLRVTGLQSHVDYLGSELNYAKLSFTDGRIDWKADPSRLPKSIKDRIEEGGEDLGEPDEGGGDISDLVVNNADGNDVDPFLMLVKTDGRWYVSVAMTVGEYAVEMTGAPGGNFDNPAEPGPAAASPEAAVRAMIDDSVKRINTGKGGDASMLDLLPQGQTRAIRIYAKSLEDSLNSFTEEFSESPDDEQGPLGLADMCDGCGVSVSNLKVDTRKSDGTTYAVIKSLDVEMKFESCSTSSFGFSDETIDGEAFGSDQDFGSGESDGSDDGDQGIGNDDEYDMQTSQDCQTDSMKASWDGECLSWTSTSSFPESSDDEGSACMSDELGDAGINLKDLGIIDVRIALGEERGGWVIDPVATVIDYGKTVISHLNDPKVKAAFDN